MSDAQQRLTMALADRYHIGRELGRGGMATVFLAEDLRHHRQVAIKVLDPEVAAAIGPERFLREIETVARLTHPHILPLHDSGVADGLLFYVMPYIEGESLRDRLTREKQLPLEEALRLTREVASALEHAHRHGVVHRDVKPENILLQDGQALVADFGVARAVAAGGAKLTATGIAVGTPAYMSPEQAAGGAVDPRTDVYGLGCVLYETLAGQAPFTGPTTESIVFQHLNAAPPRVSAMRPAVPAGLDQVITKALAKSPADRFATMNAFVGALTTQRVPAPALTRRSVRWMGATVAGVVLALVALAAWQQWWPFSAGPGVHAPARKGWILVAEFEGPRDEPDIARAAQGLMAAALDQSGIVMTVPQDQLKLALRNAGRPDTLHVDGPLARELAYRSSVRAVLEGRVSRVGMGYSILLRVSDAGSDSTLLVVNGTARDENAFIRTTDQLGRKLRAGLGEAPEAVRRTRPLSVIITPSFDAYCKIVQGSDYFNETGDWVGCVRWLHEALDLDPDCAAAYQELAVNYRQAGRIDSAVWACDQALKRPARLTEEQRLLVEGRRAFYRGDLPAAVSAFDRQLVLYPSGPSAPSAYNTRSIALSYSRRFTAAAGDLRRAVEASPFGPNQLMLANYLSAQVSGGDMAGAEATLGRLRGRMWHRGAVRIAVARDDWAKAESLCSAPPKELATDPATQGLATVIRACVESRRGEVRGAQQTWTALGQQGAPEAVRASALLAMITATPAPPVPIRLVGDTTIAATMTRGWLEALAGDLPATRRELARLRRRSADEGTRSGAAEEFLEALIAANQGQWRNVLSLIGPIALRGDDYAYERFGPTPERWLVAEAYEHIGLPDSAVVAFERVLEPPESQAVAFFPVYAHQHLAMTYARLGRREAAERHWRKFSAAFTNPDPEIRHLLDEARAAIMGLRAMAPGKG